MDVLKDYALGLDNHNGGSSLGSIPTLAQEFLNRKDGFYRRGVMVIGVDARLLHDRYMYLYREVSYV